MTGYPMPVRHERAMDDRTLMKFEVRRLVGLEILEEMRKVVDRRDGRLVCVGRALMGRGLVYVFLERLSSILLGVC